MRNSAKTRRTYFRYCDKCGKRFQPSGKFTKLCDKCLPKPWKTYKPHQKGN